MHQIIIDTETTGLGHRVGREDAIIEIAAIALKDGVTVGVYHSLCNPDPKYFVNGRAAEALRINKKTMSDIFKSKNDNEIAFDFRIWLSKFMPCEILIYNKSFDKPFLEQDPWRVLEDEEVQYGECLMCRAADYIKDSWDQRHEHWEWLKLGVAAERLGYEVQDDLTHGALYDARLAAEVYLRTRE